ncbi:hypothetical protein Scep_007383 [Stephania cephalantha]|uniref:Uncharacterized protein n=1 Tax=Stephania cephalantha TaxID=152367 RepID=A0AAP0K9S2_9MAGN
MHASCMDPEPYSYFVVTLISSLAASSLFSHSSLPYPLSTALAAHSPSPLSSAHSPVVASAHSPVATSAHSPSPIAASAHSPSPLSSAHSPSLLTRRLLSLLLTRRLAPPQCDASFTGPPSPPPLSPTRHCCVHRLLPPVPPPPPPLSPTRRRGLGATNNRRRHLRAPPIVVAIVGIASESGRGVLAPRTNKPKAGSISPKAVEPVRFRLRVSPLLLAQTGALRFLRRRFLLLASSSGVDGKQGRENEEEEQQSRWSSLAKKMSKTGGGRLIQLVRIVVCDLVNVRGKVVISSFTYNGLANPTKNGGIV